MVRHQPFIKTGVEEIITEPELEKQLGGRKKLRVKLGVDPTSKDLHLGHAVVLRMLRQFQELGHQAILVIGDFTAGIGDPAGVSKTRPVLTRKEVEQNMTTYVEQAQKILDPEKTELVYNSEWLEGMDLGRFAAYATQISVNSLIEREDFSKRLQENQPLSLHELIYPVAQGLDSVELKADIEIGGWDQRLNLLTARELQRKLGQKPETLILMKGLIGTDGLKKMSKSLGNYIGLTETPDQMFGKIMSIKDELIDGYAELAAWMDEFDRKRLESLHPKQAKIAIGRAVVELYHGKQAAERAAEVFEDTFGNRKVSEELVEKIAFEDAEIPLIQAVTKASSASSSEAKRLIEQGGIKIDGKPATDQFARLNLRKGAVSLQVGKHRFFSLHLKEEG